MYILVNKILSFDKIKKVARKGAAQETLNEISSIRFIYHICVNFYIAFITLDGMRDCNL